MSDPLALVPDEATAGGFVLQNDQGLAIGYLTARHWVSRELATGRRILHISVNGVPGPAAPPPRSITVRVAIGDDGDTFEMLPVTKKTYKLGLVGEKNYQPAIKSARPGEAVTILRERGNPHDDDALIVRCARNKTIGYVARDSWLRDVLLNEGKGCTASIVSIQRNGSPHLGVVLDLSLNNDGIGECRYSETGTSAVLKAAADEAPYQSFLSRLFGKR